MTWQKVLSEFEETGNTDKEMAEEIALLRQRLGPAGSEMLVEFKRLRLLEIDAKNYQKLLQASEAKLAKAIKERQDFWVALMDERKALAHSESKRAKLREALEDIGNSNESAYAKATKAFEYLAADAAEDV